MSQRASQIIFGALLIAIPIVGTSIYVAIRNAPGTDDTSEASGGPFQEVSWQLLAELDYESGDTPAKLARLDGARVKVPGFVVPLEDNAGKVGEFLLVPTPQACIHVPPPPANQMVHVTMRNGKKVQRIFDPMWIKGRLSITTIESQYGKVAYTMDGIDTEIYTIEY